MSLLRTEQLTLQIGQRKLISRLDLDVESGQLWCVLGRNGAGKTSLLLTLAGLLAPTSGQVLIDQTPLASISPPALARLRGLLPQQQTDAFSCSVLQTVLIGRTPHRFGRGWDTEADIALAQSALASVDLLDRAASDVRELSGGERQRVALAALLVQAPSLYLLDEPTAHQDIAHQLAMLRMIRQIATTNTAPHTIEHATQQITQQAVQDTTPRTTTHSTTHSTMHSIPRSTTHATPQAIQQAVIMNCHDINLAARFATHVLLLGENNHWSGPVDQLLTIDLLAQTFQCRFQMIEAAGQRSFIAV